MRWIVGPSDGPTVGQVLARANGDSLAVSDGRVFIGSRRVQRADERVTVGDVLEIAPPRRLHAEPIRILARTRDLIAVDKPAGIPTIADHAGATHALLALVARESHIRPSGLHPTSRLDRDVSGVVVFACTRAAAQRLKRARTVGGYDRRYVALSTGTPIADKGTWKAPIGRGDDPRLRAVGGRDAVEAITQYSVVARAPSGAVLLAFTPVTGRTHQIRVHSAHAGAPLMGDRPYGGKLRVTLENGRVLELRRIALHAAHIAIPDDTGAPLQLAAPIPPELASIWSALGGEASAWEVATACALQ